jgi:serine protease Do
MNAKAMSRKAIVGVSILLALACALPAAAQSGAAAPSKAGETGGAQTGAARTEILREYDDALNAVVERVLPSIVQIEVSGFGPHEGDDGEKQTDVIERQRAIGSGVIVDPEGYIMTNAHVVAGAQRIRVILAPTLSLLTIETFPLTQGKRVFDAKLLGEDSQLDLALIKIEKDVTPPARAEKAEPKKAAGGHSADAAAREAAAEGFSYLPLKPGFRVRVGQKVLAIGSPEGLEHTVTSGMVSAVGRQIDVDHPLLYVQTDAPINAGNSGGALVDRDGNLVGLNTFIYSEGGGSEGLGFAIPAPTVRFAYQEFKKYGHIRRVSIGAHPQTITPDLAAGLKLAQDWGVIISDVLPDGSAAAGGLQPRDIVLVMDEHPVQTVPSYTVWLYLHDRDHPLQMAVLRGDKVVKLSIPVPEAPPKGAEDLSELIDPQKDLVAPLGVFLIGLERAAKGGELPALRSPTGALVVARVDYTPRLDADLETGDVICTANGAPVRSADDLRATLDKLHVGDPVVLEVERKGIFNYVAFEVE